MLERDGKQALILKNETSSRKRCTFDCRQKDVLLFQRINKRLILAKLKGESGCTYWSMMDVDGMIHPISEELSEILNKKDWSSIQSKEKMDRFYD